MLGILIPLLSEKTRMANDKTFKKIAQEKPFSLVLFKKSRCSMCDKILQTLDSITDEYSKKITTIFVDVEESDAISSQYSISKTPLLALFSHDQLIKSYRNDFSEKDIRKICEEDAILDDSYEILNTTFDVFDFQQRTFKSTLIIDNSTGKYQSPTEISNMFTGTISIGFINNRSIIDDLNFPPAQLHLSLNNSILNYDVVNFTAIAEDAFLKYTILNNEKEFGISNQQFTVTALIDIQDPLHWIRVRNLFSVILKFNEVSFQIADFYKCKNIISLHGISSFGSPLFFLTDSSKSNPNLLRSSCPSVEEFENWLNLKVRGIKPQKMSNGLPILYARNFQNVCFDSTKDVILIVGNPMMEDWKESLKNIKRLRKLFQPYSTILFYEFNPKTEHVPGLQMNPEKNALISIWEASESPQGQTFQADVPFPIIVENVLRFITTKIPPQDLSALFAKVKKYSQKLNNTKTI